jgi:hypothetical protein
MHFIFSNHGIDAANVAGISGIAITLTAQAPHGSVGFLILLHIEPSPLSWCRHFFANIQDFDPIYLVARLQDPCHWQYKFSGLSAILDSSNRWIIHVQKVYMA